MCYHSYMKKPINSLLKKQFHPTKNKSLDISSLSSGSGKKVWWICEKNHSYEAIIYNRTKGSGCPICNGKKVLKGFNDLLTKKPDVVKFWDYEKNLNISPDKVTFRSSRKVWWKCDSGHSFQSTIDNKTKGKHCPYCSGRKVLIGFNDLYTLNQQLSEEWDYSKNKLTPKDVTLRSNKKVWWKCENNHSWQASINDRSTGTGCPICKNSLKTSFPEQAIFYYISQYFKAINRYSDKMNNISEIDIFIPSLNFGIEYNGFYYHKDNLKDKKKQLIIESNNIKLLVIEETKIYKQDKEKILFIKIPIKNDSLNKIIIKIFKYIYKISSKEFILDINVDRDRFEILKNIKNIKIKNSLASLYPDLIKQWDFLKNKELNPNNLEPHSSVKVWWKCDYGHEFKTSISNRTKEKSSGCPYCSNNLVFTGFNDLETKNKDLLKYWDYKANTIKPSQISFKSNKKVFWICDLGHTWNRSINDQSRFNKCSVCSNKKLLIGFNDFSTKYPLLLKEWNFKRNTKNPQSFISASSKKVWWICDKNHEWEASIINRVRGTNCPICYKNKRKIKS